MEKDYLLGTSQEELLRLGYQHQVWQDFALKLWQLAGFEAGQELIDLGCGPGFAALDLARLVNSRGRIHAIDASPSFTAHLERVASAAGMTNLSITTGDVHELPYADNSADGVFARWLLCFVSDPRRVCLEAARVLRPGGRFVVWDYFNYLAVRVFPERDSIRRVFAAYHRSTIEHGGSYDIGQRLPGLMIEAGLEVVHVEPLLRIARPSSHTWRWVSMFHENYVPKLVESGLMTQAEAQQLRADWQELEGDPTTFFATPPMLGIIARKPAA